MVNHILLFGEGKAETEIVEAVTRRVDATHRRATFIRIADVASATKHSINTIAWTYRVRLQNYCCNSHTNHATFHYFNTHVVYLKFLTGRCILENLSFNSVTLQRRTKPHCIKGIHLLVFHIDLS